MTNIESSILNNSKISSDKYGLAAVSYIYKAFGNFVRSKELWPFSEKLNQEWEESKGCEYDCVFAISLLLRALEKYREEIGKSSQDSDSTETDDTENNEEQKSKYVLEDNNFVKLARFILKFAETNIDIINETSDAVNSETEKINDNINDILIEDE